MWSKRRLFGAGLAILGIIVEGSAHTWSPQDAVWVGFALVVLGALILWTDGSDK